ncbi:MAG TPA: response regulator, partial [Vicinamibacterales bacterium]
MPGQPLRVLIVDDDLSLVAALERGFSDAGLDVIAHTTFEGARQALRSERFDAVLTDVRLGAFNGLQLAGVARDSNPEMKIVVFSGFDDPVLHSEAEHVGATYLVKPVTAQVLTK